MSQSVNFGTTPCKKKGAGRVIFWAAGEISEVSVASELEMRIEIFNVGARCIVEGVYGAYIGGTRIFFEIYPEDSF